MLNLPNSVTEKLKNCNNILIAGAGGGSDILCGLPLYYTLLKLGKKVHLANLTHTNLKTIHEHADPIQLDAAVFGANSIIKLPSTNYLEGYLSQFFKAALNQENVIWMIDRTAVPQLKKSYERLIDHLKIDGIILVDGGVDSIMVGDEGKEILTNKFVDTTLTLAALQDLDVFKEAGVLVSYSTSNENYMFLNRNLNTLALQGGFYGGCYLVNYMKSFKLLKTANSYQNTNHNAFPQIEYVIKLTESDFEEGEVKQGMVQLLFLNPVALIYNNVAAHKILELGSYYEIIQAIAPIINKII